MASKKSSGGKGGDKAGGADKGGWSSPQGPASLASPLRNVMRESRAAKAGRAVALPIACASASVASGLISSFIG